MGDTRRVVDGERRATARPLRPAAPPDDGTPPVPRPRERDSLPPEQPADPARDAAGAGAAADAGGEPGAKPHATAGAEAGEKPALKPGVELDAQPGGKPQPESAVKADGEPGSGGDEQPESGPERKAEAAAESGGRRRRMPFAHAVRARPRQLAVGAARATRAWSRRPGGRTTLPALFLLALVAAAATAGAVIVPAAVGRPEPVAEATPSQSVPQTAAAPATPPLPELTGLPGTAAPTGTPLPGATTAPVLPTGRPADALAGWAQRVSAVTGIPPVALQAYAYAELVLAQTNRACQLSWTTLAAIGYVESRHGSANGATLQADGLALPEIKGQPLDGQGGRSRILDTDQGALDGDRVHDRALGPMQFIPTTWQEIGADADGDGAKNPHDIDDAALAAGLYLCKGGRNMTIPGDWWGAILSYNDVRRYAQAVFDKADEYGRLSRNVR
ncbi:lytic transglycosylase domain-containing protein [Micromonospora sp. C28ISP2-4]|uniref:lytic transglycosylase domain-containing protein n=1 Tax=Micromonospora sp. C28ISP2-4 TaxID=3059523 RepID=UPI002675B3F2|nr:murein transglycosylase [Micromonospora sp. C28ISP2-4]MDO3684644.1 murein transglycosylase [Micromonospora sp. C28ISP2-4]